MSDLKVLSPDFREFVELLIYHIDGVNFPEAYSNQTMIEIDGLSISFISLKDLAKNRRATGRGIDLDDLKHLQIEEE